MKKRKTIRKEDFKKWLMHRPTEQFGSGEDSCPLHDWLERDVTVDDLEELPVWCARFVGHWNAVYDGLLYANGEEALTIMNELY